MGGPGSGGCNQGQEGVQSQGNRARGVQVWGGGPGSGVGYSTTTTLMTMTTSRHDAIPQCRPGLQPHAAQRPQRKICGYTNLEESSLPAQVGWARGRLIGAVAAVVLPITHPPERDALVRRLAQEFAVRAVRDAIPETRKRHAKHIDAAVA